jgi:dihydropteroate synthase
MFDKYLYALGRGVRGAKKAFEQARSDTAPDPSRDAKDVTPAPGEPEIVPPPPAPRSRAPNPYETDAILARIPLVLGQRPLVMGVVNVTPDSFSDGGQFLEADTAVRHGVSLVREGADILDVGGESTRPAATPVSEEEEIARVIPVVRGLATLVSQPISIDTMKARVAEKAIAAGATVINDVWGFQRDLDMARVAAAHGVHCVLMHNRFSDDPSVDMFSEVRDFLLRSIDMALGAGVARDKIIVDPGIGFGKTAAQGFELVRRLDELKAALGFPILLGVSRKRPHRHGYWQDGALANAMPALQLQDFTAR